MSAIFNFQSLLTVILLLICTCAYIRSLAPSLLDKNKTGIITHSWKNPGKAKEYLAEIVRQIQQTYTWLEEVNILFPRLLGIFWKCARIGERKSPYVAACCVVMAFSILFVQ